MALVWIVVGIAIGSIVTYILVSKQECVGSLREDHSDPDSPYMFLEVDKGGLEKIQRSKYVRLRVVIQDYIQAVK